LAASRVLVTACVELMSGLGPRRTGTRHDARSCDVDAATGDESCRLDKRRSIAGPAIDDEVVEFSGRQIRLLQERFGDRWCDACPDTFRTAEPLADRPARELRGETLISTATLPGGEQERADSRKDESGIHVDPPKTLIVLGSVTDRQILTGAQIRLFAKMEIPAFVPAFG